MANNTRVFLLLLMLGFSLTKAQAKNNIAPEASDGYQISITLTPLKNCRVYLHSYYGKYAQLVDSAWLDENSKGLFKGATKLTGGFYYVSPPLKNHAFEFLVGDQQYFSVKADTAHPEKLVIKGSPDNIPFLQYNNYVQENTPRLKALQARWKGATNAADSIRYHTEWEKLYKALFDYRETIEQQYPESMFTLFLQTLKMPQPPPTPVLPDGRKDSLFVARYIKAHYWDQVPLHDNRLLHTPPAFFEDKMEHYFRYYVVPDADTLISEVNYLLLASRAGKDMFKYLLGRFTDKYINPEIMGHDKVFIFLFNEYFSKGDTTWLSARQKQYIFDRAYSLMANQIGETAAPLNLSDTAGKQAALYSINAPFTFLVFWDPNCGHCKEMIPRIDSIYQHKWKSQGIALYAVNVDEKSLDEWKKYINAHHLTGWVHAYQPKADKEQDTKAGRANYRQLYDVFQTPTLYLLDRDKHIIGKKLSLEQFDQVMQAKMNKQVSNAR